MQPVSNACSARAQPVLGGGCLAIGSVEAIRGQRMRSTSGEDADANIGRTGGLHVKNRRGALERHVSES